MTFQTKVLGPDDVAQMRKMIEIFGVAFGEAHTYSHTKPSADYLKQLLRSDTFVAIAALAGNEVVGGIAGYLLRKFEQERSEFYIYDLAVAEAWRRQGIASGMITRLKQLAKDRGAYLIFVQADLPDAPAIALYEKFGKRERVLHFEIDP